MGGAIVVYSLVTPLMASMEESGDLKIDLQGAQTEVAQLKKQLEQR